MKSIPHDYYLKFLDSDVYDKISTFHNLTNFTMHDATQDITYLHNITEKTLQNLTGNELHLYPDMHAYTSNQKMKPLPNDHPLARKESCDFFIKGGVSFTEIKEILSPLIKLEKHDYKRGYPSGGGLYPVEVFICDLSGETHGWPAEGKVLHLLSKTRTFEVVKNIKSIDLLKRALLPNNVRIGEPNVAIVYAAYMPKTVFKYRYRGYRLANLEVGSLYMLIDLLCSNLKIQSRVWSGYCDDMLCKSLGLNPTLFFPLCTHLIGSKYE
ncbi:SagB/ThcOx family dehydrogenase [Pseudomonas syringae]|uniref:SagB/ThcOx family dehydrogenase n=1 Tax=Pseudomonas syringae TaxID=317 RepID=UPI0032D91843